MLKSSNQRSSVIFLINLLQDINIIRPLAYLVARDMGAEVEFLLSYRFLKRDINRTWQHEIALIAGAINAQVAVYSDGFDIARLLEGKNGLLIAASESNLNAHIDTHMAFMSTPPDFLKITLQHGFECVGFLQNREHIKAHGSNIRFAADVVCGWFGSRHMSSMAVSERSKLYVAGPTCVLQIPPAMKRKANGGLVCENLHSVRFSANGDFKTPFMDIFRAFCDKRAQQGEKVFLRPHPGGQYTVKNKVATPDNVELVNAPIYKVDLTQYDFGISAPSSILIDMVLRDLPVGVWTDGDGGIDASNYDGLTPITDLASWQNFAKESFTRREDILQRQRRFLGRYDMPTDKLEVRERYLRLMTAGRMGTAITVSHDLAAKPQEPITETNLCSMSDNPAPAHSRILFIAMGLIPTLQLSFIKPLKPLIEEGKVVIELLTEGEIFAAGTSHVPETTKVTAKHFKAENAQPLIDKVFSQFNPDLVVFCRYSGPGHEMLMNTCDRLGVPKIYHVDDDLLSIPKEIGESKYRSYNRPERLESVRNLLEGCDIVYCSTQALKARFESYGFKSPMIAGDIYCSGSVLALPKARPGLKIGYMGFDHAHDFQLALPSLVRFMRERSEAVFELFGSIPKPAELDEFGERVRLIEPVRDYQAFLETFKALNWDIGLCPLQRSKFNEVKANTKWVEYTSVGTAVIATKGMMYDDCCADACGILVETDEDWLNALRKFGDDPAYRVASVNRAQAKLRKRFSEEKLKEQVLNIFTHARTGDLQAAASQTSHENFLVVADVLSATQDISFRRPLLDADDASITLWQDVAFLHDRAQLKAEWRKVNPTVLILSRFIDACDTYLYDMAQEDGIPVIFHLDDDLFNVTEKLGKEKFDFYNDPDRLKRLRLSIEKSDLLYASTENLGQALKTYNLNTPVHSGKIYCSIDASALKPYKPSKQLKFGYMGTTGHYPDLEAILPAILKILSDMPHVKFETFGTIKPPPQLLELNGIQYKRHLKTKNYEEFLAKMPELGWRIGLAPLDGNAFNMCKANTKWVEYSLAGMPVIASDCDVYRSACSEGAGFLATDEASWYAHMRRLLEDKAVGRQAVETAQAKLAMQYAHVDLVKQIKDIVGLARGYLANRTTDIRKSA